MAAVAARSRAAASTSLPHLVNTPRILPHAAVSPSSPPSPAAGVDPAEPMQNERVVYELLEEQERDREERQKAVAEAADDFLVNLHYMERYEEHTTADVIQAKYEKNKDLPLAWTNEKRDVCRRQDVETVMYLAGFSNVNSKIIGPRSPLNVIKALFLTLNANEMSKDVEQKFGRTVVESYLF